MVDELPQLQSRFNGPLPHNEVVAHEDVAFRQNWEMGEPSIRDDYLPLMMPPLAAGRQKKKSQKSC